LKFIAFSQKSEQAGETENFMAPSPATGFASRSQQAAPRKNALAMHGIVFLSNINVKNSGKVPTAVTYSARST
jgi:hypothetical protein